MSDGDEDGAESEAGNGSPAEDAEQSAPEESSGNGDEEAVDYELDVDTFEERLNDVADAIEAAESEEEHDEVETTLDSIDEDLDRADLPEPDDEDEESPGEAFSDRVEDLRSELEEKRGPYADDVTSGIDEIQSTISETRWTEDGVASLESSVETFIDAVNDELDADIDPPTGDPAELATGLDPVTEAVEEAGLDPDGDATTLEALMDAIDTLSTAVEDAEEWDDLTVREQLQAQGFYDVLKTKHKDFPPEWTALKEWENEDDAEMILLALQAFDSDFLERHCLEALERMGPPAAKDPMLERADRRDKPAIKILGKIGDPTEDIVDTLLEFVGTDSDPALQKVTMKALGEMGAEAAVQPIADQLAVDDDTVRSQAARALGMLGDPRAIAPLSDVLADDEAASVRASAAWALVQIGTEPALEAAAEYADDQSYVVQSEATPAAEAIGEDPDAPTA